MFVEGIARGGRTPAGAMLASLISRESIRHIAPRWGAALGLVRFYKHSTPLGCRSRADRVFYKHFNYYLVATQTKSMLLQLPVENDVVAEPAYLD